MQPQMTQRPVLRGRVGARALHNPEGRGKGRRVVHTSEHAASEQAAPQAFQIGEVAALKANDPTESN